MLVVYIWKINIEGMMLDGVVVLVGVFVVLILVVLFFNFGVCFIGNCFYKRMILV